MIIGKPIFINIPPGYTTIRGTNSEIVDIYGVTDRGETIPINTKSIQLINGVGTIDGTTLEAGTYTFAGRVSKKSQYLPTIHIDPQTYPTITLWPSNALILQWASATNNNQEYYLESWTTAASRMTDAYVIPYTGMLGGTTNSTNDTHSIKLCAPGVLSSECDYDTAVCVGYKGVAGSFRFGLSSTTTGGDTANWIDSQYVDITSEFNTEQRVEVHITDEVKKKNMFYPAVRLWSGSEKADISAYCRFCWLEKKDNSVKVGDTQATNISNDAFRYCNIKHEYQGSMIGGWQHPNTWQNYPTETMVGRKSRPSEYGGGYEKNSTLIPITVPSGLKGKTLVKINVSLSAYCPSEDFQNKGFRWALCTSDTNKNSYINTTSKVTDNTQLKQGTTKAFKYNKGKKTNYTITFGIGADIPASGVDTVYLYFWPIASDSYGIAHIYNTVYTDFYTESTT